MPQEPLNAPAWWIPPDRVESLSGPKSQSRCGLSFVPPKNRGVGWRRRRTFNKLADVAVSPGRGRSVPPIPCHGGWVSRSPTSARTQRPTDERTDRVSGVVVGRGCPLVSVVVYRPQMPRRSAYDRNYRRERQAMLALRLSCHLRLVCDGAVADSADHDPPLSLHAHVRGSGCCRLVPACLSCQHHQGGLIRSGRLKAKVRRIPPPSRKW